MSRHAIRARAAAAAALVAAVAAVTACAGGEPTLAPSPPASSPASAPASPTTSAPPPVLTPSASPGTMLLPVYYLGETDRGPRLYREFRSAPRSSDAGRAAVDAMLHLAPLDPDYDSLWPEATRVRDVTVAGDLATVDLSREAKDGAAGADYESKSVQQLVYTVTAAVPAVRRVQLLVDGRRVDDLWGHVDVRRPLVRESRLDVLGPVWVIDPAYGATVDRTFTFGGDATVFEGTVSWDVRACAGSAPSTCSTVLRQGFETTDGAPARGVWSVTVTVPDTVASGGYLELRAWEDSAEDGRPLFRDTKVVRLR